MRSAASTAALLLTCAAALVGLAGCSHDNSTPTGLRLQREDLALAAHELRRVEPAAARELERAAQAAAAALPLPSVFSEPSAVEFTGPGYSLVALYRSFQSLTTRAWPMIAAAIDQIERGSPAARFARENVGIYIESVYDAHFGLAQIGKKLVDGYRKLKGPAAFGATLTQAEVDALAAAYSEANYRLQPHVDAKLGS